MHRDWCGKSCCECEHPCKLDEEIPCSPDCDFLGENGETTHEACRSCDALKTFRVDINYDGAVYIRAASAEDARELVCAMTVDEMYEHSDGVWDIAYGEEADNAQ